MRSTGRFAIVVAGALLTSSLAHAASDAEARTASIMMVLERERTGTVHVWRNPATGTSGTVTVLRTFAVAGGTPCRDYRATIEQPSAPLRILEGTGCRSGPGLWHLNERSAGAAAASPTATQAQVRAVQQGLARIGYDVGVADGILGPRTRQAISAYQADRGLPVDGRISPGLIDGLAAEPIRAPSSAAVRSRTDGVAPRSWQPLTAVTPSVPGRVALDATETFKRVNRAVWVVVAAAPGDRRRAGSVSLGSAVAVDRRHLLTNCHIMAGRPSLRLMQDDRVREARLIAADPAGDRCILAVDGEPLQPVPGVRDFADLAVGERVYTVGTPSGLERTLGEGIVSGLRTRDGLRYVQTTAPISMGSSGGGLFDARGNLIGITTAYLGDSQLLNFAIAADEYWR